jgi:glycosyltransferase involved in cell wall biosynthesis
MVVSGWHNFCQPVGGGGKGPVAPFPSACPFEQVFAHAMAVVMRHPQLLESRYMSAVPQSYIADDPSLVLSWDILSADPGGPVSEQDHIEWGAGQKDPVLLQDFDAAFYGHLYNDLRQAGIRTEQGLTQHYLYYGKEEGRVQNAGEWLSRNGLPDHLLRRSDGWDILLCRIARLYPSATLEDILQGLIDTNAPAYEYCVDKAGNRAFYADLACSYLNRGAHEAAEAFFRKALRFDPQNAAALGHLGDINLKRGSFAAAVRLCERAIDAGNDAIEVALNLSNAHLGAGDIDAAYFAALRCLAEHPDYSPVMEQLDTLAAALWEQTRAETDELILCDQRGELIAHVRSYAQKVYSAYLRSFGAEQPPAHLGDINPDRILIIGDRVVPQCARYRIDQKAAQLRGAGLTVETLDWMSIGDQIEQLAFYDIVIFYRVPALPQILKGMAQVTAAGKLAVYEIDDLLFDQTYPPPIHSYGTMVDDATYGELLRGMALFNAAARCCRIGLASTKMLASQLGPLTQSGECLLHRNGVDQDNAFRQPDRSLKDTVDIFYGSGTKAHNSDLAAVIIPVMRHVLARHKQARLVVMGYAELPAEFLDDFGDQVLILPLIDNVRSYYEALQWADINLAVLKDDVFNDCKSEIKWMEAACFAMPSILSKTANHRDVIEHGIDAYLATTADQWINALDRLIRDPDHRRTMGMKAQEQVHARYRPDVLGHSLKTALRQVVTALQDPQARGTSAGPQFKLAVVNVFLRPQAIGGATRVVGDNLDSYAAAQDDPIDVVTFSSDVHLRTPHRVTIHMEGKQRNYRSTILFREHMDWYPRDPQMYDIFAKFLETEKPDLIHFHCVQRLSASVVEAARDAGIPYVVTVHDAWWISDHQFMINESNEVFENAHPDPFAQTGGNGAFAPDISNERRNYLKSLLLDACAVTTVSTRFADIYARNGITGIVPAPNDISAFHDWKRHSRPAGAKVVIGHIGGMSAHKGFDLLRDVVSGMDLPNIEILAVDHAISENVHRNEMWGHTPVTVIGKTPQSDVANLYARMDVLAAPSLWPESYGLVTREAAACGCWVIASDRGAIEEDVGEGQTGFVIAPEHEALARLLAQINADPERFKTPVRQGSIRYATSQADEYRQMYKDILCLESQGQATHPSAMVRQGTIGPAGLVHQMAAQ